jgi:hypothetical protein
MTSRLCRVARALRPRPRGALRGAAPFRRPIGFVPERSEDDGAPWIAGFEGHQHLVVRLGNGEGAAVMHEQPRPNLLLSQDGGDLDLDAAALPRVPRGGHDGSVDARKSPGCTHT